MSSKKNKVRVDVSHDKESIKSRTALGLVMSSQVGQSAFAQNSPEIKSACVSVIDQGHKLAQSEAKVDAARAMAAQAESDFAQQLRDYDAAYGVLVAHAEQEATSESDIQSIGLTVFTRESHMLLPPAGIEAYYDPSREEVRITVKQAPGMLGCITEISSDPADPTKWQRLKGMGARHTVSGLPPGTYWIRAASLRASDESAYTGPVSVIVK